MQLYWTGFLGLRYTWVKASLKGLAISDIQGSPVTIGTTVILLEYSCPQAILKFYRLGGLDTTTACETRLQTIICHESYKYRKHGLQNTVLLSIEEGFG